MIGIAQSVCGEIRSDFVINQILPESCITLNLDMDFAVWFVIRGDFIFKIKTKQDKVMELL